MPLLRDDDIDHILAEVGLLPPHLVISSLMSGLYQPDEQVKWNTVTVFGQVMDAIARSNMEGARVIMRRILWNLNEESGGIGWGMPEAMGEIMAVNRKLAEEYAHMLVSYMREENFLELPALQHGLLWGIGRLAMVRPQLILQNDGDGYMTLFLESPDQVVLGLASRNFGILRIKEAAYHIRGFVDIRQPVRLYQDRRILETTVGALAREALARIGSG
ncbi:MAG: HEAT repeat domain-containing protein [Desulfobulbaceae bacterium]|nr:HEAT repeat domain-containing protein [Desulfobulbaceae bacterium]